MDAPPDCSQRNRFVPLSISEDFGVVINARWAKTLDGFLSFLGCDHGGSHSPRSADDQIGRKTKFCFERVVTEVVQSDIVAGVVCDSDFEGCITSGSKGVRRCVQGGAHNGRRVHLATYCSLAHSGNYITRKALVKRKAAAIPLSVKTDRFLAVKSYVILKPSFLW